MSAEDPDTRLRRLRMRSMRRGMKEMDIILDGFAGDRLSDLSDTEIAIYDALLSENDQEIYTWILGTTAPPEKYRALIGEIAKSVGAAR